MARRLLQLRHFLNAPPSRHLPRYSEPCITMVQGRATMVETMVRHYSNIAAATGLENSNEEGSDFFQESGLTKVFLKKHLPEMLKPEMQAKFRPLLDKLKNLGVENGGLKLLVKQHPGIIRSYSGNTSFEENLRFLSDAGLDDGLIAGAVKKDPVILMLNVRDVLHPKVGFFMERGLDGKAIVAILSKSPGTMVRDIKRELVPTMDFLAKFGIDKVFLAPSVVQHPMLLSYDVATRLKPVIATLNRKLDIDVIKKLAVYSPMVFARQVDMIEELMFSLKYNAYNKNAWIGSMAYGVRYGVEAVRDKIDFLMSLDIPYKTVADMLRADPYIFKISDSVLKKKLEFYIKEMKFDMEEVVRRPEYLTTQCLDRVSIRWEVLRLLKSRGIVNKIYFSDLVSLNRKSFVETFVYKYPDCGRIYFGRRSELKQARAAACPPDMERRRSPY